MKQKITWLLCMAVLSMVLAGIVISRVQSGTEIIFGGADGALINTDTYSTVDPNATPTPEVDEDWPDIDITQGQYRMVNDDTENLLPSSFEPTCGVIDGTKRQVEQHCLG